jgi:hypothetical protein
MILVACPLAMTAQEHYDRADSLFVVKALDDARALPRTVNFPLHFARLFLGRPYVGHTLEVCDPEQLVVNTRELDCTTLVENVTALTLCVYRHLYSWRDFLHALLEMRYRNGQMEGYTSRLHYFSDWIEDNTRLELVSEIQDPQPPFSEVQTLDIHYMSRHPQAYRALKAHPDMVQVIADQEAALTGKTYRYIPKKDVGDTKIMKNAVRDGDILAITCHKDGLDIAHLGFAVWRKDGLHLLNASQLHHKVVEEPMTLQQYLSKHPSHTGIRVVRIIK